MRSRHERGRHISIDQSIASRILHGELPSSESCIGKRPTGQDAGTDIALARRSHISIELFAVSAKAASNRMRNILLHHNEHNEQAQERKQHVLHYIDQVE